MMIAPFAAGAAAAPVVGAVVDAAVVAQLAGGEELDDAVLDVVEAVVVGVEHQRGPRRGRACRRCAGPTAARRCGRATCAPTRARATGRSSVRNGRAPWRSRSSRRRAHRVSSSFVRNSPTTSSSPSPSSLRIELSCWRSSHSRCCLSTPSLTSSRIDWATCSSARWLRAHEWMASTRSDRLTGAEHDETIGIGELGPGGHGVGEFARGCCACAGSRGGGASGAVRRSVRAWRAVRGWRRRSTTCVGVSASTSTSTKVAPVAESIPASVDVDRRRRDPGPLLDLDDRGRITVGQVADVRHVGDDAERVLVAAREHEAAVRRRRRGGGLDRLSQFVGVERPG